MDDLSPSDLKTILHSKRANMYYLKIALYHSLGNLPTPEFTHKFC
jgi:hypothetical protein